jgi:hypothetical protein
MKKKGEHCMRDDGIQDRELVQILTVRRTPAMPEGLSERVIAACVRLEQEKIVIQRSAGTRPWMPAILQDFSEMFFIPRPAAVFATLLVVGLSLGAQSAALDNRLMPGMTPDELAGFMRIEDRFVAYEFLSGETL